MAKVTITIEDTFVNGQAGASFQILPMQLTEADHSLPDNQVSGAAAVAFAIRALWRNGALYEYATDNIDALIEEAALEVAISEKIAAQTVNQNIAPVVS